MVVLVVLELGWDLGSDSEGDVLGRKPEGRSWRKINPRIETLKRGRYASFSKVFFF